MLYTRSELRTSPAMEYDRIKDILTVPMWRCSCFRRLAYKLFELGFLRVRHVKRELANLIRQKGSDIHVFDAGFGFGAGRLVLPRDLSLPALSL